MKTKKVNDPEILNCMEQYFEKEGIYDTTLAKL
jgi:hypothetical protein